MGQVKSVDDGEGKDWIDLAGEPGGKNLPERMLSVEQSWKK